MDYRKMLKNQYKQTTPKRGIYIIHNLENGKVFVGSSLNVEARINRFQFELAQGIHKNDALQNDFKKYGINSFSFEIAELIEEEDNSKTNLAKALSALEETWLDKVQPFGDRGYNR